ncbi:hypothetical protein CEXT_139321 [Caerostris extrusa]|uniref:Uncharacterized protein n=1 Tax=Caerostris extrusa TaxID=172846 RepID=A0AAV4Y0H1_CAEEX|nr:hypothetical protein CEXT_139321 [Caerostris extrusa]
MDSHGQGHGQGAMLVVKAVDIAVEPLMREELDTFCRAHGLSVSSGGDLLQGKAACLPFSKDFRLDRLHLEQLIVSGRHLLSGFMKCQGQRWNKVEIGLKFSSDIGNNQKGF